MSLSRKLADSTCFNSIKKGYVKKKKKGYVYLLYSFKIILLKTSFVAILKDSIISQESTSGNFSIEERQTKTKIFSFWKIKFLFKFSVKSVNYGIEPKELTEH